MNDSPEASESESDRDSGWLPPVGCYAVIFSSRRTAHDRGDDGAYAAMAARMVALAGEQRGFLGVESARNPDGSGITVSYWEDEEAIRDWKAHAEHRVAQENGKARWYEAYTLAVARVTRASGGPSWPASCFEATE